MCIRDRDNSDILEFIDNGHTGTNFERPAVQELLTMVQAGKINCITVSYTHLDVYKRQHQLWRVVLYWQQR